MIKLCVPHHIPPCNVHVLEAHAGTQRTDADASRAEDLCTPYGLGPGKFSSLLRTTKAKT